ncbi:MAG: Eco57I restriction-modification methylase domain-containing protein [Candidatus Poribacteria bacterium]|nr:Eco57I restriction-modification methylase domain-containing protein [Candidatus Poribacteria bacterium]
MQINFQRTRQYLKEFKFEDLFIEELGWDEHTETLNVPMDESEYVPTAIAHKCGVVVFHCSATSDGLIPERKIREKIHREVAKSSHENLIIYTDTEQTKQIWQWASRERGKTIKRRELTYNLKQSGELLIQKLRVIAFSFNEEEQTSILDVIQRLQSAFNVEKVTKKFYDHFKKEHDAFLEFLSGIPDEEMQKWYVLVMLNRLMFIYFIEKKGFLNSDINYLQTKLRETQENGTDQYYKDFLCPLFFEGFAKPEDDRSEGMENLLGKIPYLNGGIFQKHQLEVIHDRTIEIPDTAFEKLFAFFEQYQWHLDDRPLKNDNEINPDVLGYIFEKYINQKQMGAYYTKEDITEYISKNTIIPFLFDKAREKCKIAFEGDASVWKLLQEDPDRYIYDAVKKGVDLDLPAEIAVGIDNVSERTEWNTLAPAGDDEYALPAEIWREVVARQQRCKSVRAKLENGEIDNINDLITYNLNIRQFAQDVLENCEGPELLRAFWKAITEVTVLDPTCGSGAFLFAALNILEPFYEACLDRMQVFLDEVGAISESRPSRKYNDFRQILDRIAEHPNRDYFILKSIIINNLYGVDIMEEAIEICKLRLFLKMVAQIEDVKQIEPLPDIDFNIQAGNTLVGFATDAEIEPAFSGRLDFDDTMELIIEKAEDIKERFTLFRQQQMELGGAVTQADKAVLQSELGTLEDELNEYLADIYDVDVNNQSDYQNWLDSHKPFHWFIAFYGILQDGGFDVIIGNPPYVKYSKVKKDYKIIGYETESCGNLYTFIIEGALKLLNSNGFCGMIIPISAFSNRSMQDFQNFIKNYPILHVSNFHQRPAQLFEGVLQRLSIFLIKNSKEQKEKIYTTSVIRWGTEARDILFDNLVFSLSSQSHQQHILKVGNDLENSILEKYQTHKEIRYYLSPQNQKLMNIIAYRTAGGGYWWTFLNTEFKTQSLSNKVAHFDGAYDARVFMGILSSSLFWWYYFINYDLFNLKDYMIFSFKFNYPTDKFIEKELICLAEDLEQELLGNAIKYEIKSKTRGTSQTIKYQNSESKLTIDKIDLVLAEHYGFTDEELDFIINYDIKYRMGLGN